MPRLKSRPATKIDRLRAAPQYSKNVKGHTRRSRNPDHSASIRKLLQARLAGPPLTFNKRIKREYQSLADQIASTLMRDARRGKFVALRMLIESTEEQFLRASTVCGYVDRIYGIICAYVRDKSVLQKIGAELLLLKAGAGIKSTRTRRPPVVYTGPEQLSAKYHPDPETHRRLNAESPIIG